MFTIAREPSENNRGVLYTPIYDKCLRNTIHGMDGKCKG